MNHHFLNSDLTLGLEIELQIINPKTQDLSSSAKQLIRNIKNSIYQKQINPEITQSMIEINSSIHHHPQNLHQEMLKLCQYLKRIADKINVVMCGGGTHPFQNWATRKIFPTARFRELSKKYGYLAKRFTAFSMHVHVGCNNEDKAIYLTHRLSRFIPQLIVLSASSPFYNGINTGYDSTRVNIVNAFPMSGHMPYVRTWEEFSHFYHKMHHLKVINSMKDLYWDIRPKPEYGTIEIRIFDMPLSLSKAIALTAYLQTLCFYLAESKTVFIKPDYYQLYEYNRFQASRFGFNGFFIDPLTLEKTTIQQDILDTIKLLSPYAKFLNTQSYLYMLKKMVMQKSNDAAYLKKQYTKKNSLVDTVKEKCEIWGNSLKI